jgi:hypothetical protein
MLITEVIYYNIIIIIIVKEEFECNEIFTPEQTMARMFD